jgi:hypothetical protein
VATYSIERLSISHIPHLQTLYKAAFGTRVTKEFLLKKYDTGFAGERFIGYLAMTATKEPAAFYGVLPCMLRLNGTSIRAAQSADTMTHPRHRRGGLFVNLAERTYALAREKGIEVIFGFPNQNSLPGFNKLRWKFLDTPMQTFTLPANPLPLFRIISRFPFLRRTYDSAIRTLFPLKADRAALSFALVDGVIKDEAFLGYKSYSHSYFIAVDDATVWIKPDGMLKIGHLGNVGPGSMQRILKKLRRLAFLSGLRRVVFITSANTFLFKSLCGSLQAKASFPIGFYPLTNRDWDFSSVQFEYCDIDIF